jgi:hypothetical protein
MELVLERDPLEEQVVGISENDGEIMHQLENFLMTQYDMTYLEIIALAIYLWNAELFKKRVLFHVDNMAVVAILNKKTSKSARALSILRHIVYWTLIFLHYHKRSMYSKIYNFLLIFDILLKKAQELQWNLCWKGIRLRSKLSEFLKLTAR